MVQYNGCNRFITCQLRQATERYSSPATERYSSPASGVYKLVLAR